jgi:hypothetical protein
MPRNIKNCANSTSLSLSDSESCTESTKNSCKDNHKACKPTKSNKLNFENSSSHNSSQSSSYVKNKKNKNKKCDENSTSLSETLVNCDSIKLLEIIESLNKEVKSLKRKVAKLEKNNGCDKYNMCGATETYLNNVDKTVANKLDELTNKVNDRLKCLENLIISTRKIIKN